MDAPGILDEPRGGQMVTLKSDEVPGQFLRPDVTETRRAGSTSTKRSPSLRAARRSNRQNKHMKLHPKLLTIGTVAALGVAALANTSLADPGRWHGREGHDPIEHLSRALALTDAQKAQVKPILEAARPQLEAIHSDARTKAQAVIAGVQTKITAYLTPEQQEDLRAIKRIRERMQAGRGAGKDTAGPGHPHFRPGGPQHDPMGHLSRALGLTDAQKAQVKPIFDSAGPQLEAIRADAHARAKAIMADTHNKIVPLLTPEQRKSLEELKSRHAEPQGKAGA